MAMGNLAQQLNSLDALNILNSLTPGVIAFLIFVFIWKMSWYGVALYKSGIKKQKPWFVVLFICMLVLNDLGLLAMLYLIFNREKKKINSKKKKL